MTFLSVDPYGSATPARPARFLHHLNPLAKIAAVVPAMAVLLFTRDLFTPLAFIVLGIALILIGARVRSARLCRCRVHAHAARAVKPMP